MGIAVSEGNGNGTFIESDSVVEGGTRADLKYEKERLCEGHRCRRRFGAEKDSLGGWPERRNVGTTTELSEGPLYDQMVPCEPQ